MNITDFVRSNPVSKYFVGYGDAAIYGTVEKIKHIVNASAVNPYVRKWAEKIVSDVGPSDKSGEARAIHDFVKYNVRYTKDPYGFEYIQTPVVLLKQIEQGETPAGDCDDMTVLSLSLLKSIGFPVAVKVTSYSSNKKYSHVYGLVNIRGKWIPFETIKRDRSLGWEAPNPTRFYETVV